MSEPENTLDPQEIELTPAELDAVPVEPQPVEDEKEEPTEPEVNYKALYDQEVAKEKRHLEQLAGKDKLIKQLQETKIAEAFQPVKPEPEYDAVEYGEETSKVVHQVDPNQQLRDQILVRSAVQNNISDMRDKYGSDQHLPFTKEVQLEVEAELDKYDPRGTYKLYPNSWDQAYHQVRSRKMEEILAKKVAAVESEKDVEILKVKAKETAKIENQVESTSKPKSEPIGPSIEDVLSGRVQLSSVEMREYFGKDIQSEYDRKLTGI